MLLLTVNCSSIVDHHGDSADRALLCPKSNAAVHSRDHAHSEGLLGQRASAAQVIGE